MTETQSPAAAAARDSAQFSMNPSRGFVTWLQSLNASIAFSTYKLGKVFWIGTREGKLNVMQRDFSRVMGLAFDPRADRMAIGSLWQIWLMRDMLQGQLHEGHDRFYAPRASYATGDVDSHDIAILPDGIYFVNTLFSCIARASTERSFDPVWKPPFISKVAAEDRCHLNGMAIRDGKPAYVTAVSQTDIREGWRDHKQEGGIVVDVASGEVVCRGLSMPHSPRWYRDRLWVLNSGTGEFGSVNLATGTFEPLCFCPGFLRGLAFVGDFALMGLSRSRDERAFSHLPLATRLAAHQVQDRCGIYAVDLRNGDIVQRLEFDGALTEMYDVAVLPGVRNPTAIGIRGPEVQHMLRVDP